MSMSETIRSILLGTGVGGRAGLGLGLVDRVKGIGVTPHIPTNGTTPLEGLKMRIQTRIEALSRINGIEDQRVFTPQGLNSKDKPYLNDIMSERIYPPGRNVVILPPTRNWPGQGNLPISTIASAAGTVIDRGILPQLLRQGIGRMGSVHGVEHFAQGPVRARLEQMKKRSGLYGQSLVDRIQNARDRIKKRVRGQTILPTPYGPRSWPGGMGVGSMASVGAMTDASGPAMGMYPMQSRGDFSVGDGRDISIHEELDNVGAAGLDFGMSVHVE